MLPRDFFLSDARGGLRGPAVKHIGNKIHIRNQPGLRAVDGRKIQRRLESGHVAIRPWPGADDPPQTFLGHLERRLAREDPRDRRQSRRIESLAGLLVELPFRHAAPRGAPGCPAHSAYAIHSPRRSRMCWKRVSRPTRARSITSASACKASAA